MCVIKHIFFSKCNLWCFLYPLNVDMPAVKLILFLFFIRNEFNIPENAPLPPLLPSVEELRNVWVPYSLKMKLSKNKELEVLNCEDNEEVRARPKCGQFHTTCFFLVILHVFSESELEAACRTLDALSRNVQPNGLWETVG